MFHLLSFSGRWDPKFFEYEPVPQAVGEEAEDQKKKIVAAVQANAKVRLAKRYDRLSKTQTLDAAQRSLVQLLHNGALAAEAWREAWSDGHGRDVREHATTALMADCSM